MKKFAVVLAAVAAISTPALAAGDAEAGKAKVATCTACHGADGNSPIDLYPKLAGQHEGYLLKQLIDLKKAATSGGKEGRNDPVMSPMAMMLATEQDMADVAAYYAGQLTSAGNSDDAELIAAGEKLYLGGDPERQVTACVACHGVTGQGMQLAGYPSLAGQHTSYLKAQLEKFRSGARNNDMNGMMSDISKRLSDDDINALSHYLNAQ
ncbi:c-type cytochrome [Ferrimonas lipolytica]|uniref:Cytochrome c4 n=1 Tax=Ferrimonas lipolytica TaxID=2724191 RepID=A0A6H1UI47_9GAMM|nr:c-type cytochrome [Ferrimonas lipolytica]QIZ78280.1 cytochrome c4 [Ferrimonas lipolytica]